MGAVADFLRAQLFQEHGITHGFSLRGGGVSRGPYASLNLGGAVGDDAALVEQNRRRLAQSVGFPIERLFELRQVHGAEVRTVGTDDRPDALGAAEGDALVGQGEVALGIRTADCVPVLFADPRRGIVGAAHAGWRGAVGGVLRATVEEMRGAGSGSIADLIAAIGPHIRVASFEIGEEVAEQMRAAAPEADVVRPGDPRPFGDLTALVCAQLQAIGIPADRIEDVGGCTYTDPERFFSHRRDQGMTGRHLAVVVAPST